VPDSLVPTPVATTPRSSPPPGRRDRGRHRPLEEIAAGVAMGTLYRRFGDREGPIKAVVLDAVAARFQTPIDRARRRHRRAQRRVR